MSGALVLLHGFTGGPESFDALGLTGALAPALAGHRGGPPRAADFRAEVDRLAALMPYGAHVVGYSLGARLALGVALEHPARVARLTLIGVNPGLTTAAERRDRAAADARWIRLLEDHGIERFIDEWEALPMWASQAALPADVRARQRRVRLGHDARALAGALRALGLAHMPDYGARLGELAMPVHLIAGRDDAKFRTIAEQVRASVGDCALTLVPECGHNPIVERPELVAALLRPLDTRAAADAADAHGPPPGAP